MSAQTDLERRMNTAQIQRITIRYSATGPFGGQEQTFYGMDLETRSNGETHVRRTGYLGWTRVHGEVVSVEPVTDLEYRALLEVGRTVIVPKYGNHYSGTVEEVNRTRVVVRFYTRTGTLKRAAFPIRLVGLPR